MPSVARQWPVTFRPWLCAVATHGVHLLEGHAQRVVVVGVRRGGVAGRVGLDPLDAVLDQLAHGGPRLVGAVDEQHQPLHADLAEVGVPVHQPADAADLAAAGRQARAGHEVVLDGLLQPDVDVEQAAAAAGRGVAALQGQPGVGGGQQRDVLDRVLDVEVFEGGDVEVGRVEVGLDQPRHDGAAAGVDPPGAGCDRRRLGDGTGVGDAAVANDQGRVRHGRRAGAVDQLAVGDYRSCRSPSSCYNLPQEQHANLPSRRKKPGHRTITSILYSAHRNTPTVPQESKR